MTIKAVALKLTWTLMSGFAWVERIAYWPSTKLYRLVWLMFISIVVIKFFGGLPLLGKLALSIVPFMTFPVWISILATPFERHYQTALYHSTAREFQRMYYVEVNSTTGNQTEPTTDGQFNNPKDKSELDLNIDEEKGKFKLDI